MLFNTKKFNKEIFGLKHLPQENLLHPLKKEQLKQVIFQEINSETNSVAKRYIQQERRSNFMKYIISTLLGLSILGGTAFASNSAKPGDLLYPVKKAKEKIQINLSVSEEAKAKLQAKFGEERLKELNKIKSEISVHATGTPANIKAKVEAEGEVSNAITTLKEVQTKLEAKGNTTAAAAIGETIVRLQAKEEVQGTTTINSNLKPKSEDKNDYPSSATGGLEPNGNDNNEDKGRGIEIRSDLNTKLEVK